MQRLCEAGGTTSPESPAFMHAPLNLHRISPAFHNAPPASRRRIKTGPRTQHERLPADIPAHHSPPPHPVPHRPPHAGHRERLAQRDLRVAREQQDEQQDRVAQHEGRRDGEGRAEEEGECGQDGGEGEETVDRKREAKRRRRAVLVTTRVTASV